MNEQVRVTEWAIEVTWLDWKKAGADGPTSQYGPFSTASHRDSFLEQQRRDRDVAATRVLERQATYTPWQPESAPSPTTPEEREALLTKLHAEILGNATPAPASDPAGGNQGGTDG